MSSSAQSVFFQSLGCPKNLVDAEVMLGLTQHGQHSIVQEPSEATVIILNTCSFIEASKRESIETLLNLLEYKASGKCKRFIVTGCLPQRYKADLKVSFPEVDAFVGTGQYGQILDYISGKREDEEGFRHPKYLHSEHTPRINSQPFYRAYLKLSEGCIKNCAFCIIPKIRGTLRSRTIPSLVEEARRLVEGGALELNLIAQDLTDYGRDLRDGTNLPGLLRELVKVKDLRWVRLLYVYPDDLSDDLLDLIGNEEKICKYLDMPVQHIEDRVLNIMNRKVTGNQIRARIAKLKKRIPDVSLRSTVIVGYPSETQAEFRALQKFVEESQFDHLGVFAYSHEEGTASYSLPHQLEASVKAERRDELMELQRKVSSSLLNKHVGAITPVLMEEISEESEFLWRGRHQGQAPDIDGHVLIRNVSGVRGTIQNVKLEKALEYDLVGRAL